ncbi:hypothetical protein J7T55_004205 [Diaporthe amygdali]|uniref:uncharacterized protein n=1 Tax=Phomopsis amygdali TaxID=1214568 RepID=UPI0022FF1AA6|nr:uncharacterized protein J7T55_004205 [Diaporthe amygdali]KAJ0103802.1 hypothetical protein J7T55_004205 [Diaporthe amygdali]
MHIVGKTSDDKYYDVVMCDSCAQYLHHIGCAFELESDDFESVHSESVEPAESFESEDFEFVHSESVEPAESFESEDFEFVHAESAEPIQPINFVSVNVVFVEFGKLKFDDIESAGSGEPVYDEIESEELRKSIHYDVSQPKQREIKVYGTPEGTTRARGRFIVNAVRAISSADHGRGLDQYYLSSPNYTNNRGFLVAIKWAVFLRSVRFTEWDDIAWLSLLEKICLTRWQLQSTEADMQELSLLQAVFESACDRARPNLLHAFNSAQGNLETLSSLFFDGATLEAVPFGGLDRMSLERWLPQFKVFEDCDELDVTKFEEKIISCVPL